MVARSPGVLLLVDGAHADLVLEATERFADEGRRVLVPAIERADWDADRRAIREIGARADAWRAGGEVDDERLAVVGFGRGGTLAFLLGCAQRFEAVVDVDGPVLYPGLGPDRPTQPLELGLNLEGAFLGSFAEAHPGVDAEQLALLRERLTAAARPFELERHAGVDGPEAWRATERLARVGTFLRGL